MEIFITEQVKKKKKKKRNLRAAPHEHAQTTTLYLSGGSSQQFGVLHRRCALGECLPSICVVVICNSQDEGGGGDILHVIPGL
jgi:hypothetical protein